MSEEKHSVDSAQLRGRLRNSILSGAFFAAVVIAAFTGIRSQMKDDGIPDALRSVIVFDQKVGQFVYSERHLSPPRSTPPAGKLPRVNGLIGMDDEVDDDNFKINVESGEQKIQVGIPEIQAGPRTQVATDFKCVEGWSEVIQYAGLKFSDFIEKYKLGRKPNGDFYKYVGLETPNGEYYVSIDIESMLSPQTVLAYEMNASPLREEDGFPIRLLIPNKYGIKNIKRIGRIFFSDIRPRDYWTERGYDWYAGL